MSRFLCRCGYEIRDITCPSTHEARLVTDLEADDFEMCTVDAHLGEPTGGRRSSHVELFNSRVVMECPQCWRLWVQVSRDENRYIPFMPEEEPLKLSEQQGGYRG